jgi:hypothetical protein
MRLCLGIALLGFWTGCAGTLKLKVATSESPPKRVSVLAILTKVEDRDVGKPGFLASIGCLEAVFGLGIDAVEGHHTYLALSSDRSRDVEDRPREQFFQSLAGYVPADGFIIGRGALTRSARELQSLSVRLISARTGTVLSTAELTDLGGSEPRSAGQRACRALLTGKGS